MNEETPCSSHPDAPHSFMRDASHNAGRYVCECEGWLPSSIYEDNGYASREHYLECLSEDYNVPLDTYVDFVGEQSKGVLSYNDVLEAHKLIGHIQKLMQHANTLGYKYIIWNGLVYLADGTPTVYTRDDIR